MSTPASATSGISPTQRAASSTTTSSTTACTTAASREDAPERTFTAVRAIAAVAGIPPNSGAPRLARPCPTSSRSESCRPPTLIPSATVADSRLSSAASAATAIAGSTQRARSPSGTLGNDGSGSPEGRCPMVASPRSRTALPTVTSTTATSEPGSVGRPRASSSTTATTATVTASGAHAGAPDQVRTASNASDQHLVSLHLDAQGGRHLLQRDDHRDADREALDHRDRHVADEAPGAGVPQPDQEEAGHQPDDEDAVRAVGGDDRHQHDGHRPGRPAHLHPAAAEDRRQHARDDRGHQTGARPQPRADPEAERERQRDQPDQQARASGRSSAARATSPRAAAPAPAPGSRRAVRRPAPPAR